MGWTWRGSGPRAGSCYLGSSASGLECGGHPAPVEPALLPLSLPSSPVPTPIPARAVVWSWLAAWAAPGKVGLTPSSSRAHGHGGTGGPRI